MSGRFRALLAGAALGALPLVVAACGPGNSLGGSASELFPLSISRVEVQRNEEALQVSYYRNNAADVDLVARVSVSLSGVDLAPGKKIDLAGEYAPGHPRTTVVHIGGGEPARALPPVKRGDLQLSRGGEVDERTAGDFSLSFEDDGGYGSGRTLFGSFDAVALDAGFGPDPGQP